MYEREAKEMERLKTSSLKLESTKEMFTHDRGHHHLNLRKETDHLHFHEYVSFHLRISLRPMDGWQRDRKIFVIICQLLSRPIVRLNKTN